MIDNKKSDYAKMNFERITKSAHTILVEGNNDRDINASKIILTEELRLAFFGIRLDVCSFPRSSHSKR